MRTAIDNYQIGKQKEVSAEDFPYKITDNDRFYCPECLEPVTMVDGKNYKFFKHGKRTVTTAECDRRSESNANKSIYQRVGLPLFLRLKNNKYKLCVGFRRLPDNIIDYCIQANGMLVVERETKCQKYKINYENFSSDFIVYKELSLFPDDKLKLSYSKEIEDLLKPYWSDYIECSISKIGALFHDGNNGGKIIRVGDNITTNKNYIWVLPESKHSNLLYNDSVDFNEISSFQISGKKFKVYEGKFVVSSRQVNTFKKLANDIKKELGLFLLDSDISIMPLWPPCVRTEIGYNTQEGKQMYFFVDTDDDNPLSYLYIDKNVEPITNRMENINGKYFGVLTKSNYARVVNINRRVVSSGSFIKAENLQPKIKKNYINDDMNIYICFFEKNSELSFDVLTDCELYILDKYNKIEHMEFKKGKITFEEYKNIKSIYILCNKKLVVVAHKKEDVLNDTKNIDLSKINKILMRQTSNQDKVYINSKIAKIIKSLMGKDELIDKKLKVYLRNGIISRKILKDLRRIKND